MSLFALTIRLFYVTVIFSLVTAATLTISAPLIVLATAAILTAISFSIAFFVGIAAIFVEG